MHSDQFALASGRPLAFVFFFFGFFSLATRCCGGLFATTFTARSKRAHASEFSSIPAGFFVMDAQAVEQAEAKWRKAKKSLEILRAAKNYEGAEEAWSDFLLAASTIYSKLEQGSKSKGSSGGWFGRKKKERKDDPVLRYLHYARNSDEHGIERVAARGGNLVDITAGNEPLKFNERREKLINTVHDGRSGQLKAKNIPAMLYGPSLQNDPSV